MKKFKPSVKYEYTLDGSICEGCSNLQKHVCSSTGKNPEHTKWYYYHTEYTFSIDLFAIPEHVKTMISAETLKKMHAHTPLRMVFSPVSHKKKLAENLRERNIRVYWIQRILHTVFSPSSPWKCALLVLIPKTKNISCIL